MSDFVVFEEQKANRSEFSCQTEEIALEEVETQTVEKVLADYHTNDENPEITYWEAIVANRKKEVDRIKKMNEKMITERTEKLTNFEIKQAEYDRLYELGNEQLKSSKEEDETTEDEEENEDEGQKEGTSCK